MLDRLPGLVHVLQACVVHLILLPGALGDPPQGRIRAKQGKLHIELGKMARAVTVIAELARVTHPGKHGPRRRRVTGLHLFIPRDRDRHRAVRGHCQRNRVEPGNSGVVQYASVERGSDNRSGLAVMDLRRQWFHAGVLRLRGAADEPCR